MKVVGFVLWVFVLMLVEAGVLFVVTAMILDSFKLAVKVMTEELSCLFLKNKKVENQTCLTKKRRLNFIDSYSNSIKIILSNKNG